jgi:CheY-like chemotaxis protein/HPt (histidine-containing phosphotransfer) domain-containing protein
VERGCLRILLVEDNPVNQKLAVRVLEKEHHRVVVASNGRDALRLLGIRSQGTGVRSLESGGMSSLTPDSCPLTDDSSPLTPEFDLVLMDVQMPEMDGYETTAHIRRHEQRTGGHLPILAMTAYAMKGDQEHCLAAGMDGYVSKPVRVQELLDTIQRLVTVGVSAGLAARPDVAEEVLDWATALEYVAGDRALLKDLIGVFLDECPRWMEEIRTGMAAKDSGRVQRASHKLKGTLGNFGAELAYETAMRLETMCRTGSLEGVEEVWGLLQHELGLVLPALATWAPED